MTIGNYSEYLKDKSKRRMGKIFCLEKVFKSEHFPQFFRLSYDKHKLIELAEKLGNNIPICLDSDDCSKFENDNEYWYITEKDIL